MKILCEILSKALSVAFSVKNSNPGITRWCVCVRPDDVTSIKLYDVSPSGYLVLSISAMCISFKTLTKNR